ncbi:hypothetical protein B484DRAFT_82634 [Ochromonadaceae sp. CCMP2298]|nr:hypothetical protein B484DRAFT_82634 [Ochromonadaceae sp. CCMP2298]
MPRCTASAPSSQRTTEWASSISWMIGPSTCPSSCHCSCTCSSPPSFGPAPEPAAPVGKGSASQAEEKEEGVEGSAGVKATSSRICCRALQSPSPAPSSPPPSPSILPLSSTMSYLAFSSSHLNSPSPAPLAVEGSAALALVTGPPQGPQVQAPAHPAPAEYPLKPLRQHSTVDIAIVRCKCRCRDRCRGRC